MSSSVKSSLAAGYTSRSRLIDYASIILFFVSEAWLWVRLAPTLMHHPLLALIALLLGYILADFVSGLVHWLGDTWGNTTTPIFGNAFIRPFREHHVDQMAITRHDFVETNGANCLVSLIILVPANVLLPTIWGSITLFFYTVFASTSLSVFATNQFHKWAHQSNVSRLIGWLQKQRLILSPGHHNVHHTKPFDHYYCITVGWLNPLLERITFFRRCETIITSITKALPRTEDLHLVEKVLTESGQS